MAGSLRFLSIFFAVLLLSSAFAAAPIASKYRSSDLALSWDNNTYIWANDILTMVYNDGNFAYDNAGYLGKTDGLYYPFLNPTDDKTVLYAAGIWLGAKVNDQIRVAVAEYSSEFCPGPMVDGHHQPDQGSFRVYKIGEGRNADGTPYDDSQDWTDWPYSDGAPVDSLGQPLLLGNHTCWSVFNDADTNRHWNMLTYPLGVEIQHSTFAFSDYGPYRHIVFLKYVIINKGGNTLDSMYVSLWVDPDVGDASDDLVGCDTNLSLGFAYNDGPDEVFGYAVPAVGFDFFRGPLVDSPGDTVYLPDGVYPDRRMLGMASFNKYINGTDPQDPLETYNYMRGLNRDGSVITNPVTGYPTTYFVSGDPVTATGWLDEFSADRRFMMSSGPFVMEPNDTQVVVAAIVAAQSTDPISGVALLREIDQTAQGIYEANFDLPSPPPEPALHARGFSDHVSLIWEDNADGPENYLEDYRLSMDQLYTFEGYNVYIADDPDGPWTKVVTFDYSADEMQSAYEPFVDSYVDCEWDSLLQEWDCSSAQVERIWDFARLYADINLERVIVQSGTNSELSYGLDLIGDPRDSNPFETDRPYYFGVSAYGVNIQQVNAEDSVFFGPTFAGMLSHSLESSFNVCEVLLTQGDDSLSKYADHVDGTSDGYVIVDFLVADDVTGDDYEVTFNSDGTWNLFDMTTAEWLLTNQENISGDYNYPIVDGMMVRVAGPNPGIKAYTEYFEPGTTLHRSFTQAYMGGRNVLANGNCRDFVIKFLANPWDTVPGPLIQGYKTVRYLDENLDTIWGYFLGGAAAEEPNYRVSIPFAFVDLGDDPENPADDFRIWPLLYDFYGNYRWYVDDYMVILNRDIGGGANLYGNDFFSYAPHDGDPEYWGYDPENPISRHDWDYRMAWDDGGTWQEGDSIIIVTYNINTQDDIFRFSSSLEVAYVCGDANGNGDVDIDDIVFLVEYVFASGTAPYPYETGDPNCSGDIDIDDIVYLVNFAFVSGPVPCDPDGNGVPDCETGS